MNSEISGASELFVSSDTNEGRWDDNMNTNGEMGGVNIIIVIILVIATIGTVLYNSRERKLMLKIRLLMKFFQMG